MTNFFKTLKLDSQEYVDDTASKEEKKPDSVVEDKVDLKTTDEEEKEEGDLPKGIEDRREETEETETEEKDSAEEQSKETEDNVSFLPFIDHFAEESLLVKNPDKKYEDSPEGFAEVIKDTVEAKLNEVISSLPPDAAKLFEIAKKGGNVREIIEAESRDIDFSNIDMEDEENQYNLTLDHLIATGIKEERAKKLADSYKDAGLLSDHAAAAQEYFIEAQKKEKEARIAKAEEAAKANAEKVKTDLENLKKEVFEISKVGDIELSKKDQEELYNYITKPVKDGKTQSQLDGENPKNRLFIAFLTMKKFDTKDIEKKVESKKALELKKQLTKFKDTNTKSSKSTVEAEVETNKIPNLPWMQKKN